MRIMHIAVIGAGRIGGTIGEKWTAAGHEVAYGLRDPGKRPGAKTIDQALRGAEVMLLAVPANAVVEVVRSHHAALDGKIVIDATNNFAAAEFNSWPELAKSAPHAHLYRAFNTLGWDVLAKPVLGGVQADLFYCGPEGPSKDKVEGLISDAGLRPIWVGRADQVATVDGVLRLWAVLARMHGRRIAFKLIADQPGT
jgi:8-hydroxy-5-deazaflavin:NADPH oxidoreductase